MVRELAIEHLKSGLSLNTHIGCSCTCVYCVLRSLEGFPTHPEPILTPDSIRRELLNNRLLYYPGETPLYINNRTDPFDPLVAPSTYRLLEILVELRVESPVLLVTRLSPPIQLGAIASDLNLLVFFTRTGLSPPFETFTRDQVMTHLRSFVAQIPFQSRYHYLRPVIPGLNDNAQVLVDLLKSVASEFRASVVGGLRVLPHVRQRLLDLGHNEIGDSQPSHKYLEGVFLQQLWQLRSDLAPGYAMYRHTSCAIAAHLGRPERLGYFSRQSHCDPMCSQVNVCSAFAPLYNEAAERFIRHHTDVLFVRHGQTLVFEGSVTQELAAAIRCAFGLKVAAKRTILTQSEQRFLLQ